MQHNFNTKIAKMFGLPQAVIFQNIWYWVKRNELDNKNCFEGRWWVYGSVREMSERFNYLTQNQIRKAINDLVKGEMLIKGNFNKTAYDRTAWYSLTDKGYGIYSEIEMEMNSNKKASRKN